MSEVITGQLASRIGVGVSVIVGNGVGVGGIGVGVGGGVGVSGMISLVAARQANVEKRSAIVVRISFCLSMTYLGGMMIQPASRK